MIYHTLRLNRKIKKLEQIHLDLVNEDEFPPRDPLAQISEISSQDLANPIQDNEPPKSGAPHPR